MKPLDVRHVLFDRRKKEIRDIYLNSFPKNERMPFPMMVAMSCLVTTKFLSYYDGDTPCGFIYMAKIGRQAYILFFAVDEKLRSKGYGSAMLKSLQKRYPGCNIAVSIEPCTKDAPDIGIRERRKRFYERNGFADTGYDIKLFGAVQELLQYGKRLNRFTFSLFLIFYSCLAIIPNIKRRTQT